MVRENKNAPQGEGVDANKGVDLGEELRKAGKDQSETTYPEGSNALPIDIRGDAEPEKKG